MVQNFKLLLNVSTVNGLNVLRQMVKNILGSIKNFPCFCFWCSEQGEDCEGLKLFTSQSNQLNRAFLCKKSYGGAIIS